MVIKKLCAVAASLFLTVEALAGPPEVTSLFPAGAMAGTTIKVSVQGKLGEAGVQAWCNRPGFTVSGFEKTSVSVAVPAGAEPGLCWLRFYNDDGASSPRPFVIGTCPELNENEPNDEVAKGEPLPELPVVVNGQHGKNGDADVFAVSLKKGQNLVASLMANRTLGSPQDAVLQLLSPEGFVLEQNEDDQGFDPQLSFVVPADGIYFLRTWAFPASPDSSIRLFGNAACVYRLLVTTGPFVDHCLPSAVCGGLPTIVSVRGWNLEHAELDVFPPVSAIHRPFEWPISDLPISDLQGRLPATVLVQQDESAVEVEPNPLPQPQSLPLPICVTGEIATPRDVDAYQFSAVKGQKLRCEVIARDAGSLLDPVLRIYDSMGKILQEADDDGKQSADPEIEFTAPADGEYRATVTDRFLHHANRYFYRLSIAAPDPDFQLSVGADSFQLSLDKPLEIPVTVNRMRGFAEEINIQVQGLPAGVTFEAVTSEPKGDRAKSVKLMLKSDGQSTFAGPIRISGRPSGSLWRERTATVELKAFQSALPELWLTVKK